MNHRTLFKLCLAWLALVAQDVFARPPIVDGKAVRAIVGEAANQSEYGMLAIACAIRNRGTLQGVQGIHARHIDRQPKRVFRRAEWAWWRSGQVDRDGRRVDITGGATHWCETSRGEPYWAAEMIKTVKIGQHQFYRRSV